MSNIPAKNGNGAVFQLSAVTLPDGSQSQAVVLVDSTGTPVTAWPLSQGAATDAKLVEILDKLNASLAVTGPLTDEQLRAAALVVTAATLPLPAGAATEAKQDTGNASLASILTKLADPATQATLASVLSAIQAQATKTDTQPISATALPLPAGAASETTVAAIRDRLPETAHAQPLTDDELRAAPVPVSGTFYPATQSVSVADLPLPDGAATDAKLDAVITKLDQLLTQMLSPEVSFRERIALTALAKQTFTANGLRVEAAPITIAATQTLATVTTVGTVNAAGAVCLGRTTADTQGAQQSTLLFQSGFRRNLVAT